MGKRQVSVEGSGRLPPTRPLPGCSQRPELLQGVAVRHLHGYPHPGPLHLVACHPQEMVGGDVVVEDH